MADQNQAPDIDSQIQTALRGAIKGGYGMDEALEAIHGGLVGQGAPPEWARSKLAKYGYTPQAEQPSFGGRLYQNLIEPISQGVQAFADPTGLRAADLAKSLWQGQVNQGQQAVQAAQGQGPAQGMGPASRASEAVGHGLAALLPGMGPMAAQTGEDIGNQNHGAAWGDILSLAAGKTIDNAIAGRTPKGLQAFASDPVNYKPEVGLSKALIPSEGNSRFLDNVHEVGGRINEAAGGVPATNVDELIDHSQKAADKARAALEPYFQRAERSGLTGLKGTQVVQATQAAVDKLLTKPSDAQLKQAIMDETKQDYDRFIPLRGWKQELENINKQEFSFYNKTNEAQRATLGKVGDAVRKAQRDAMSDMLYKALSPEDAGAGPKQIQASLGNILDVKDAAMNRRQAIRREEPESNIVTGRRVLNQGLHMLAVPLRAVFSDEAVGDPVQAVAGKSNTLIRRSMRAIEPNRTPYPTPASPVHPAVIQAQAARAAAMPTNPNQPPAGPLAPRPAAVPQPGQLTTPGQQALGAGLGQP